MVKKVSGVLFAAIFAVQPGIAHAGGADKASTAPVAQQVAVTRMQIAKSTVAIEAANNRIQADSEQLAKMRSEADQLRSHVAAHARLIYVSEGQPDWLVMLQAPNLSMGIHLALERQAVNADARRDTGRVSEIALRSAELQRDLANASMEAARLTSLLESQVTLAEGLDVATKVMLWDEANHLSSRIRDERAQPALWEWPIRGARLSQGFGPTSLGIEPPFAGFAHFHTGYDIATEFGTAVVAAFDGVVIGTVSAAYGYGKYVVVGHPEGTATLYAHLSEISVAVGQSVSRGQRLGAEGSSGNSTGPHLHFEVLVDGRPVDPGGFVIAAA